MGEAGCVAGGGQFSVPKQRRWRPRSPWSCAVTVLAAPGTAFADPGPTPSPRFRRLPVPAPGRLRTSREKIDDLYRQAAVATDAYNLGRGADREAVRRRSSTLAQEIVEGPGEDERAEGARRAPPRGCPVPERRPAAEARSCCSAAIRDRSSTARTGCGRASRRDQGPDRRTDQDPGRTWRRTARTPPPSGRTWRPTGSRRKPRRRTSTKKIAAAEKLQADAEGAGAQRLAELEQKTAFKAQTAWLELGRPEGHQRQRERAGQEGGEVRHGPDRQARTCGAPRARTRTTARG